MRNILYIGLDVDDKSFHGAGICEKSEEMFEFSCRPNFHSLLKKLKTFHQQGFELQTCYEATDLRSFSSSFLSLLFSSLSLFSSS